MASCGVNPDHKPAKADFIQGKWRKQDEQGYRKGLYGPAVEFMMVNAGYKPIQQVIIVPQRYDLLSDCLSGKIYTLDGKLYLYEKHYHVLSCEVIQNNQVRVTIEFEDTEAREVYFEYF
jgi:hypothetical protein